MPKLQDPQLYKLLISSTLQLYYAFVSNHTSFLKEKILTRLKNISSLRKLLAN